MPFHEPDLIIRAVRRVRRHLGTAVAAVVVAVKWRGR
jgi:hypothetical protein